MKSLTASKNIENRFDHSGTSVLLKRVPISEIRYSKEFQTLLPINPATLEIIKESMKKYGYDESQPIHIWKEKGEIIDGFTRLQATKDLGFYDIPVYEHSLGDNIKDVMQYVATLQVARRNLTDAEILIFIEKLGIYGLTAKEISETLDISIKKVERARSVLNNATEEQIEAVKSGKETINSKYNEVHPKSEKTTQEKEQTKQPISSKQSFNTEDEDFDDISDSLSDSSGNPAPLNFNCSDGIERPSYKLSKEEDIERTLDRKNAYENGKREGFEKGYSDGAYEVYEKIFELLESGLSIAEVKDNDLFADFTYSVISKKISN